ncbi:hypothetical protein JCM10213v2_007749 [Rhodosporidiobolus nylandii]
MKTPRQLRQAQQTYFALNNCPALSVEVPTGHCSLKACDSLLNALVERFGAVLADNIEERMQVAVSSLFPLVSADSRLLRSEVVFPSFASAEAAHAAAALQELPVVKGKPAGLEVHRYVPSPTEWSPERRLNQARPGLRRWLRPKLWPRHPDFDPDPFLSSDFALLAMWDGLVANLCDEAHGYFSELVFASPVDPALLAQAAPFPADAALLPAAPSPVDTARLAQAAPSPADAAPLAQAAPSPTALMQAAPPSADFAPFAQATPSPADFAPFPQAAPFPAPSPVPAPADFAVLPRAAFQQAMPSSTDTSAQAQAGPSTGLILPPLHFTLGTKPDVEEQQLAGPAGRGRKRKKETEKEQEMGKKGRKDKKQKKGEKAKEGDVELGKRTVAKTLTTPPDLKTLQEQLRVGYNIPQLHIHPTRLCEQYWGYAVYSNAENATAALQLEIVHGGQQLHLELWNDKIDKDANGSTSALALRPKQHTSRRPLEANEADAALLSTAILARTGIEPIAQSLSGKGVIFLFRSTTDAVLVRERLESDITYHPQFDSSKIVFSKFDRMRL